MKTNITLVNNHPQLLCIPIDDSRLFTDLK